MPGNYATKGVSGGGTPRYGSEVNPPSSVPKAGNDHARPLSASGKPLDAAAGFTPDHKQPLLTPTPHEQKRDY